MLDPDPAAQAVDVAALEQALTQELGGYFAPPIWSTQGGKRDEARLARVILEQAVAWPEAVYDDPVTGLRTASQAAWKKLERRLSKQAWLESAGRKPPWPLTESTPPIVTFYSFKGGVGRTTALVSCAWQLARAGKKVVVVDLDLEAPGLGALLEVKTDRGLIDLLADHLATGACDLDGAVAERVDVLGAGGDLVNVISAGALGGSYLEKLSRLDFVNSNPPAGVKVEPSPIEEALRAILDAVKRRLRPDYILLDSRAGLHDLAGLSLHSLAHVDVLVGRANEQGYRGFDLALQVLAKRKGADNLKCVVAHTFAAIEGSLSAKFEEEEYLHRSYASFVQHVYGQEKAGTIAESDDTWHRPVVVRWHDELNRFPSLGLVEQILFLKDFVALRARIEAICTGAAQ